MLEEPASRLRELLDRRRFECRLTEDRALSSVDEAASFLADRGLLTLTPDSALPSLFEACHEEPYMPGGHGFAAWPRTKYTWAGELEEHADVVTAKLHRGKTLFMAPAVVALADPVCRAELDRARSADTAWRRLIDYLGEAGPATLDVVQEEVGLRPRELKALRYPLERCGVLVSRSVERPSRDGKGHVHTSELARWDQVVPAPSGGFGGGPAAVAMAVEALCVTGVRAAVVAPEREVARWFSWSWRVDAAMVARLVDCGTLVRPASGWVSVAGAPPDRRG